MVNMFCSVPCIRCDGYADVARIYMAWKMLCSELEHFLSVRDSERGGSALRVPFIFLRCEGRINFVSLLISERYGPVRSNLVFFRFFPPARLYPTRRHGEDYQRVPHSEACSAHGWRRTWGDKIVWGSVGTGGPFGCSRSNWRQNLFHACFVRRVVRWNNRENTFVFKIVPDADIDVVSVAFPKSRFEYKQNHLCFAAVQVFFRCLPPSFPVPSPVLTLKLELQFVT